jgi:hypothetical protein
MYGSSVSAVEVDRIFFTTPIAVASVPPLIQPRFETTPAWFVFVVVIVAGKTKQPTKA